MPQVYEDMRARSFHLPHRHSRIPGIPIPAKARIHLAQYVLVQCGTPEPELSGDLADAMVVEVPVQRFWEGGGATFAALDALGVLDRLIGVNTRTSGHKNHFLPDVVARVTQDDIFEETSYGDALDLILNGDPDVYFQYNGEDWRNNALQVGVPAIHYSPFSEGPLGSAEQVKFVSLFFNKEKLANELFASVESEYVALARQVDDSEKKSTWRLRADGEECHCPDIGSLVARLRSLNRSAE